MTRLRGKLEVLKACTSLKPIPVTVGAWVTLRLLQIAEGKPAFWERQKKASK